MDAHRHPDPQRGALQGALQLALEPASRPIAEPAAEPTAQTRPSYPHPSKEEVRAYMERRKRARQPPPAPAEIRRQLGWYSGAGIAAAPAALVPIAPVGFPAGFPAVLPAVLAELAVATLLAWCAAFAPVTLLSEKNDRKIT